VGTLFGDNNRGLQIDFAGLNQRLSQTMEVRDIQRGTEIPPDVDVLLVFGGGDLDEYDLFPIDQFIMRGGQALFGIDSVKVDLTQGLVPVPLAGKPVFNMLSHYGVEVKQEFVLDEYAKQFPLQQQVKNFTMTQMVDYPEWVMVMNEFVSKENPITNGFMGLDLLWVSPLSLAEKPGTKVSPLVSSTPKSWLVKEGFDTNPYQVMALAARADETRGSYVLGCTVTGSLSSYFEGKQIPKREGVEPGWNEIKGKSENSRLIVIGDSDFASDLIQYTDSAYNLAFLSNAVEWLGNDEDLLTIKTRSTYDLRLNKIQDPNARASVMTFAQILNVVVIPLLVIAFGVYRSIIRRRKQYHIKQEGKNAV